MLRGAMPAARVGAGWLGRASGRLPDLLIQILLVELGQVLIAKGLFAAAGPCPSADLFNRIFSREPLPPATDAWWRTRTQPRQN